MKEIIQREDMPIFTLQERETHFKQALQRPKDKLRNHAKFLPSYRFWHDYYGQGKFLTPRIVGFTINHEYCAGVRWSHVVDKSRDRLKVLVYVRTNIVKQAFSAIHGRLLHEKCGVSNVRLSESCRVALPLSVNVSEFYSTVSLFFERQYSLLQYVKEAFSSELLPSQISFITYEELLQDTSRLFDLLDVPQHVRGEEGEKSNEWVKRSSGNLADSIKNINELREPLLRFSDCQGLKDQLEDVNRRVFPIIQSNEQYQQLRRCVVAILPKDDISKKDNHIRKKITK